MDKLTRENYFSLENNLKYMGSSQFKTFFDCEARGLAEVKGEWIRKETIDLLVGKYVDAYFDGVLDLFEAEHPEIIASTGKTKGELKSNFKQANEIIARIQQDKIFMYLMGGQKQVIMTGVINGVDFKIMIDNMHPDLTVDRKIMKDCDWVWNESERIKQPFWRAWGYDIQAAIYQEIRSQNDGDKKDFALAVATKEIVTDLRLFKFKDDTLKEAYNLVYNKAPRFDSIKKGLIQPDSCGVCDYCKSKRVLKLNEWEEI